MRYMLQKEIKMGLPNYSNQTVFMCIETDDMNGELPQDYLDGLWFTINDNIRNQLSLIDAEGGRLVRKIFKE